MKFIHCKRNPHKDWGVNDPVNLEHCVSYSEGTVEDTRPGREKGKAFAIHITMLGCKTPITWTFVDERHRDWELGRLVELTYEPSPADELAALHADEPADPDGIATRHAVGVEVVRMLATVVGKISDISKGFVDEIERGQRRAG